MYRLWLHGLYWLYGPRCPLSPQTTYKLKLSLFLSLSLSLSLSLFLSWVTNCFSAHERVLLCLFPELRNNEVNKHNNNTRVSAETVRHDSTCIIIFLTRHNESINDNKYDFYTSFPCLNRSVFILLMTSQSIADDVTITRQLWCDHAKNNI